MTGRRPRKLGKAERALWENVARTTNPLPGRMEALKAIESADQIAPEPVERPREKSGAAENVLPESMKRALKRHFTGENSDRAAEAGPDPHSPSEKRRRGQGRIDRPVHRKLARGHLPLDATLDLHGLDQAAAHGRLTAFIVQSHRQGLRHVLVITGKGASFGSEGVLRRAVPMWLAQPGLSAIVSGVDAAGRSHGGEGAIYVRLKKNRGRLR